MNKVVATLTGLSTRDFFHQVQCPQGWENIEAPDAVWYRFVHQEYHGYVQVCPVIEDHVGTLVTFFTALRGTNTFSMEHMWPADEDALVNQNFFRGIVLDPKSPSDVDHWMYRARTHVVTLLRKHRLRSAWDVKFKHQLSGEVREQSSTPKECMFNFLFSRYLSHTLPF